MVTDYQRVSIARMFIAGVVPGILMAIALLAAAWFLPRAAPPGLAGMPSGAPSAGRTDRATVRSSGPRVADGDGADPFVGPEDLYRGTGDPGSVAVVGEESTERHFLRSFVRAVPGLLVPVIILGGIYGGIFTPTESAVVAAVYALVVGLVSHGELTLRTLHKVFVVAAVQSSVVMLIVGAATVFAYVITANRVANTIADLLLSISENRYVILLVVLLLLLVVGAFLDAVSALYLFVPILVPVMLEVGVDITTIGVLMVVNLAVGLITPPVGVNLFVAAGIARIPLTEVVRGVGPFFAASLAVLVLVTFVPALSNWLPDLLGV